MELKNKLSNDIIKQGNFDSSDVELALRYLYSPSLKTIPKRLKNLNELQWILLSQVLEELLEQKENSILH